MFGEYKIYQHFSLDEKGVNASYGGSLLWQNNVLPLSIIYSNARGDWYIFRSTNWDLDLN